MKRKSKSKVALLIMIVVLSLRFGNVVADVLGADDFQIEPFGIIDITPPEITGVELSVDEVNVPGVIEVILSGSDDISGLESGWLRYKNNITDKEISIFVSGDKIYDEEKREYIEVPEGKLMGILKLDQYQYPGIYELSRVTLDDRAGNSQIYYKDITQSQIQYGYKELPIDSSFTIINEDIIDKIPPEIIGVELSVNEVEVPGVIEVILSGSDDISGLESGWLRYKNNITDKEISIFVSGDKIYDEEKREYIEVPEGKLMGILKLDQYQYPGIYELSRVTLDDRAGNSQIYYKDITESQIQYGYKELPIRSSFTVINDGGGYKLTTNTANPNLADDIKKIESPAEGEPPARIGINYETGSKVPETVFEAVYGENKELVFEGGSIQWIFNGKDIKKEKLKEIDLNIKINNLDKFYEGNANEIKDQVNNKPTYVLSFPNNGELPGKATIRLKVDYEFVQHLGREDLSIYYFDHANNKLVSVKKNVNVSSDGFIEFEIDHNSDFLIVNENVRVKSNNANLKSLTLDQGVLSPSFSKNSLYYKVNVGNNIQKINIGAIAEDSNATVEGIGEKNLKIGYNNFSILVRAEDGKTTKSYRIEINRVSNSSDGGATGGTGDNSSGGNNTGSGSLANNNKKQTNTTLDIIKGLSKKDKETIVKNLNENIPYTSIDGILTEELVKKLTNNKFTKKELEEISKNKTMLKELGIDNISLSAKIGLTPVENPSFNDIKDQHWAYDLIMKGAKKGFIAGMPDGSFKPNEPLQVADTFTFLDRVFLLKGIDEMKLPRSVVENYITDKEHWAFNSIASISSKLSEDTLKIIKDLGKKPITRELLAQILFEITDGKLKETKIRKEFSDIQESPYKNSIDYCIRTGLLVGTSETTMSPEKALTRVELIVVLNRLDDLLK